MASSILSQESSTGFYKAPVCKGLMCSMILSYSAIHVPVFSQLKSHLICEIPQVLNIYQIWKILLSRLSFIQSKDVFCSVLIIYYFRIFERRMGSRKFASYLFGSCILSTCLEISTYLALNYFYPNGSLIGKFLPPGLYTLLFPLFIKYFLDIPRISSNNFMGIHFSVKTIVYLLGLQVASTSPSTLVSSICGIIGGLLYRSNFLVVQKWLLIPKFVSHILDKSLGWILSSNMPKENLPMGATLELQRQEEADRLEQIYYRQQAQSLNRNRRAPLGTIDRDMIETEGFMNLFRHRGNVNSVVEPSEIDVRNLVEMGFEEARAREALRSTRNDMQAATSLLLHQHS